MYKLLNGPLAENDNRCLLPEYLSIQEKTDYEKNKKQLGPQWHYYDKELSYKLNSNFYRDDEWNNIDWKESIVVFGCSHVFGEGLPIEETICRQLQNIVKRPVINLGQSGTSTIFSWHNSIRLFENFGIPHTVIQLWTDYGRLLYYTDDKINRLGSWSGSHWDNYNNDMKALYKIWNKNLVHSQQFFKFEALACENFWSSKTNYYQASYFEETANLLHCDFFPKLDVARDFIHFGKLTHKNAAKVINENCNLR